MQVSDLGMRYRRAGLSVLLSSLFLLGMFVGTPVAASASGGCSGDPDACWFVSECNGICVGWQCNGPTCRNIGVGQKCYDCWGVG